MKTSFSPYLFAFFFSLFLSLHLISTAQGNTLNSTERTWLKEKGEIVFVSQTAYPPFEFVNEHQDRQGMCIELARWIATEFGFKARFQDMSFKGAQRAILSGKADVLTSFFYSKIREEKFDFTHMTWEVPALIFVSSERPDITGLKDLQGKRIAMQHGDYASEFLQSQNISYKLVPTFTFADAVDKVVAGEADAVIGDKQIVLYHLYSNQLIDKIKSIGEPLYIGQNSMGLRSGSTELQSILNKGMQLAHDRGIFPTITNKWTGISYAYQETWIDKYLTVIMTASAAFFLFACTIILWNTQLRRTVNSKTKELSEREVYLRTLIETIPDLVWLKDPDGVYLGCNLKFERFFGVKEKDILGKTDYDFVDKELADFFRAKDLVATKAGKPTKNEEEITYADDSHKEFLETVKTPMYDQLNNLVGVLGVARDITERKQVEKELGESQQLLDSFFNSLQDGFSIINTDLTIRRVNAVTANWYQDQLPLEGKKCHFCYQGFDTPCAPCPTLRCMETGKAEVEIVQRLSNAKIEWFELYSHPLFDPESKEITGVVEFVRDITERKHLEQKLEQAHKMEAVGTLAGGIAHDFNNILAAILGYAEMAKEDVPPESTVAKDLEKVLEGGNRAKDLVQQILAFSRQHEMERIPLQPVSVVKEAIKMLRPSLPTTIEINQDITTATGLILADPTQIHQIVMNLCTNAFHAMEKTGGKLGISIKEVTLSTEDLIHESNREAGTFVQLSISDSGPGIPPTIKKNIFDPYFTTKEIGKGTGMGLAIVHGIVKSYGGFISLYSEPGEGTTFHVFIPVIEKEPPPETEDIEPISLGSDRILFIDDEEILAEMGKGMLERLGYHVTVKNNSIEALETFQNQPDLFDLVITDQTMPGMTGADIARKMIQIRPDIPIILCTGYSTVFSEEKAKSLGIKEFALKPLSKRDLAVLIRKVLDNP